MSPRTLRRAWLVLFTLVLGVRPLASQAATRRALVSRADLEMAATTAERAAKATADKRERARKMHEAQLLRDRLRDGDFQSGHRILLSVIGDSALSDTFTVRADRKLQLPNLPAFSVAGLLQSELQERLDTEIRKYVKNPTVRATGLLQVTLSGGVGRPGFYNVPMDALITDAIMVAGGPTQVADVTNVIVKRGSEKVLDKDLMNDAIRSGLTLADVGMRPGDQLEVGQSSAAGSGKWQKVTLAMGALMPLIWLVRVF